MDTFLQPVVNKMIEILVEGDYINVNKGNLKMEEIEIIRSYWRLKNDTQDDSIYTDDEIIWEVYGE